MIFDYRADLSGEPSVIGMHAAAFPGNTAASGGRR
jgi:hypothetical protein